MVASGGHVPLLPPLGSGTVIYSLMLSMHNIPGGIDKVLLLVTGTVRIPVKLLFY